MSITEQQLVALQEEVAAIREREGRTGSQLPEWTDCEHEDDCTLCNPELAYQ